MGKGWSNARPSPASSGFRKHTRKAAASATFDCLTAKRSLAAAWPPRSAPRAPPKIFCHAKHRSPFVSGFAVRAVWGYFVCPSTSNGVQRVFPQQVLQGKSSNHSNNLHGLCSFFSFLRRLERRQNICLLTRYLGRACAAQSSKHSSRLLGHGEVRLGSLYF